MAKIPFDIKYRPQIESGEYKVVTRTDEPVRIICWDKKEYEGQRESWAPIVYLLLSKGGCEHIMCCTLSGLYSDGLERDSDLFLITPEPELSEFEKGYMRIVHKMNPEDFNDDGLKIAKEEAAELLDLARKEIIDGWSNGLRDTQDRSGKAYSDGYKLGHENGKAEALKEIEQDPESSYAFKRGVEYGKEEALKDLPRWRKWETGAGGNGRGIPIAIVKRGLNGYELVDALGIQGEQYIMLSDLEKLTGFND